MRRKRPILRERESPRYISWVGASCQGERDRARCASAQLCFRSETDHANKTVHVVFQKSIVNLELLKRVMKQREIEP